MKQFSKDLGNVSLSPKGKWSREQEYKRLALVYNACDNLSYVAKINVPIGVDIENREYWQPMNATGYADNNFINLTIENENGTITAYESIEEAIATIVPINRRVGATLSFYNLNADRLDRQAEFELWQFNSTDLANWENKDYWNNIYYNWNVFAGWYVGADALKNHVETPNVGQYAYVGSNLNDALLYQCRTNGTWTNTGIKVRNYISVVVSGNITIGENGNWFSDGKDTGIPATPAVDEQIDNIIAKHESLSRTVQGIAVTGGANTATNVTYNNDSSGLNAENAQDAIDELQGSKIDKTSILQELGEAENKIMSQKAVKTELDKKTNKEDMVVELAKKANTEDVDAKLDKKFDKESVAQKAGNSEELVMSQKAVSDKLRDLDNKVSTQLPEIEGAKNEALNNIKENEQSAIFNFNAQRVTPEMLSESTKQLIETSGGGTITNLPDDEDLTSVDNGTGSNVLKFADRTYNANNFSGKGYKILRKNIQSVNIASTKITITEAPSSDGTLSFTINGKETQIDVSASTDNTTALVAQKVAIALQDSMSEYDVSIDTSLITLTRKSSDTVTPSVFSTNTTGVVCTITDNTKREFRNILMPNMINKPNTIYEIRYDFDLNGKIIEMQEGCTLKFKGGCLHNGSINFNNTSLESTPTQIFNNIEILGEVNIDKSYCEWFGGGFNCDDSTYAIKQALKMKANEFIFYKGVYNISDTLLFNSSNIRINQKAIVKAIANMDCLILFDFRSAGTGGIYGISTLNYITGGGCVDGNGLANICIALDNILHSRIYNLKIKNGKQYCLELDYKDYNSGYCYIDNLEIYNELLIKDAIGIHANRSDSNFSNIQLIDFKYSILEEKESNYYYVHGWALSKNFYLDNDCEVWKESALIKLKNISNLYLINCENDTLRYLVTKDNNDINYKPTLNSIYHRTYANTGIIPLEVLNKYPQKITSSNDITVHNYTDINHIDSLIDNKVLKLSITKNKTAYGNLVFYGYPNSNTYSYFCFTNDSNNIVRLYNNNISNNVSIYFKSEENTIDIYLDIKGTNSFDKITYSNTVISYQNNIPNDAVNLLETNANNVVLFSNYFKKLAALSNFKYLNVTLLTYVEEIDKFVFCRNKNFKYISLEESKVLSGETSKRPTVTDIGFQYFDTTLKKPIWWTGTKWIDATGANV